MLKNKAELGARRRLIERYSEKALVPMYQAELAVSDLTECMKEMLIEEGVLRFPGFFTLSVEERPERKGFNPKTMEHDTFPPTKVIKLKVARDVKEAVKQGE